jgi:magnesium chelatase subunit D
VNGGTQPEISRWSDAVLAAALFAVDPVGLVGVSLRALAGPMRDAWLAHLRQRLPPAMPMRRVPLNITDGRLLGGLDLAATLAARRPVADRGLLVEADGGVVLLAMAERLAPSTAARLTAVLDTGEVALQRDGIALTSPARFGVVLLDEGMAGDERPPEALRDRAAFQLDLSGIALRETEVAGPTPETVAAARLRLPNVRASAALAKALCSAALSLGIASLRAPLLALRVARAAAALAGRDSVSDEDAALAARLVLGPRAMQIPASPPESGAEDPSEEKPSKQQPPDAGAGESRQDETSVDSERPLDDVVLEAAQAAIPADLLAQLRLGTGGAAGAQSAGRVGVSRQTAARGRPVGVRRGLPRSGVRLNVIETLRAAAPWQRIRRSERGDAGLSEDTPRRIEVRGDDFHVTRFKQRTGTTTIFVVDASGSSALHRLAEVKGAVELLLADCYVRRDSVALLSFRGRGAELLLPPTRSLVRAKRSLAGLPGGGGTPLAAGIDAAASLADAVRRRGQTPVVVLLTDGRANIAADGTGGRAQAEAEARLAARSMRAGGFTVLLVDTSPRPQEMARQLATEMGASYLPLPHAGSAAITGAVLAGAGPAAHAIRAR